MSRTNGEGVRPAGPVPGLWFIACVPTFIDSDGWGSAFGATFGGVMADLTEFVLSLGERGSFDVCYRLVDRAGNEGPELLTTVHVETFAIRNTQKTEPDARVV